MAQPGFVEPPSEFELPELVRQAVARLQERLFTPARAMLSRANAERTAAVQRSQQALAEAEAAFQQAAARFRGELEAAKKTIQAERAAAREGVFTLAGRVEGLQASLSTYREKRKLSGASLSTGDVEETPVVDMTADLDGLERRVRSLVASEPPRIWPKRTGLQWISAAAILYVLVKYPPLLIAWPILWAVWRQWWRRIAVAKLGTVARALGARAAAIEKERKRLEDQADARTRSADSEFQAKVHDLDVSLRQAAAARSAADQKAASDGFEHAVAELPERFAAQSAELRADVFRLRQLAGTAGAAWDSHVWEAWKPDLSAEFGGRIGSIRLLADDLAFGARHREVFSGFELPALIPFSSGKCVLLRATGKSSGGAAEALKSLVARILANTPPGKARFTFVDPVGLGHNVADFMALGDFDQSLIGGKAWTEPRHISEQLADLTEHMETVIQKYLRNDHPTILAYNETAQEVAEPFHFLVIFDFPANFTEESARRLVSIVRNGARCGVFTMMTMDTGKPMPYGFSAEDLVGSAIRIDWTDDGGARWDDPVLGTGTALALDTACPPDLTKSIICRSGELAVESMKVEVPFAKLLSAASLTADRWWQATSANELDVPLGPAGARRQQAMTLGRGLAHHALVVGRTGSGKTNLMHVLITTLALKYSPDELQLYLIDFKGGVGFKPYAAHRLPHAAVIAIESEREFGLSVLHGLDATLRERFELFRAAGVDNIGSYRGLPGRAPLPRILLLVDEYQEFFSEEDSMAQQARSILDRIVRQGRSFGIHLVLGSQSLSGFAQLPTSTLGQMAVRIALPCNEADARLIFSDDNLAAKSLSRPGEAIYNAGAGAVEANSPFQAALFGDTDLEYVLGAIDGLLPLEKRDRVPVVFEGNEPAIFAHASPVRAAVSGARWPQGGYGRAWLGEPVAMRPPVECVFDRGPGRHLLIVDRDEQQGLGVLHAAWLSLLFHHRPTTARFFVVDMAAAETPWATVADNYRESFDHQIELVSRRALPGVLGELASTVRERLDGASGVPSAPIYLLVQGLQRVREIRFSPEHYYSRTDGAAASPAEIFMSILKDGPEAGVHVLAWCDTVPNAKRAVDRGLQEFGLRVAGAMSLDDSSLLLDSPDAARLAKPHRVLFVEDDKPGVIQKFRPFQTPPIEWVAKIAGQQRGWSE